MRQSSSTPVPVCLILASLLALPAAARAVTVHVDVGGPSLSFRPNTVTINVGDTVVWTNRGGSHNVVADDNSFASGSADAGDWAFPHTFNTPGTFNYHCQPHGALGMTGTVIVQAANGGEERGALRFSQASYSVSEGGAATITVQRVGGDDGAVSVTFGAIAGSASAADFTAVSGTLAWADNDDSPKTFTVATANDAASEGNETVQLRLTNPTGGATLGSPNTALLTLQDNDGTPGGTPAAPAGLQGMAHSATEIMLSWTDSSNNETGFAVERRTIAGTFQQVATLGANTETTIVPGLDPSTFYLFRVRALGGGTTSSGPSNEVGIATLGLAGPCIAGPETLCINGGRFQVEMSWRTSDGITGTGKAVPIPTAPDSGLFYFFNASNLEMLLKVLNACGLNQRYWVFFAATTNVEFAVVVTDTQTGQTRSYFNPLNRPAPPVQDTDAFATCP
ncbi:MAG TPA: plastocyanin/azurin family copper-binding protein [Thermoanaerobaculia bacterium]|nr:plastocyanin/azurin family copper-binding protein [Thermoanaerobaculia bacterium]